MFIDLPSSPCAEGALDAHISAQTPRLHQGKRHRGHVDRRDALLRRSRLVGKSVAAVVESHGRHGASDKDAAAVLRNAAQALNHALEWRSPRPPGARAAESAPGARIGPGPGPDQIQWEPNRPKTRAARVTRRTARKFAEDDTADLRDISIQSASTMGNVLIDGRRADATTRP